MKALKYIAKIQTDFPTKFGIPRQSGLVNTKGTIVFEPEYRKEEALKGLEEYSHLWLIWQFSAAVRDGWSPTVRPPKLGGNKRIGVFATRSPFRPNAIGLSCVKLEGVRHEDGLGDVLIVSGADLRGDPIQSKHADWVEELKKRYIFTEENAMATLMQETGRVFTQVLEDAGVYKRTPEGKDAFLRFVEAVNA